MNNLYEIFHKFYSECEYLNHLIFTGSFGNSKVSKVYSCKELFELEDKLSTEEIFDKCLNELNQLIDEFNTSGSEVKISLNIKKFRLEETKWCQKS